MSNLRYFTFFSVMLLLFGFVWQHVWFRLVVFLGLPDKVIKFALAVFIVSFLFQVYRFIVFRSSQSSDTAVFLAYFLMGLFTHLFFAALTKDLLILIPYFSTKITSVAQLSFLGAVILNLWGVKTAMTGPIIREVRVPTQKQELQGFRIAQVSDLHVGPIIKKNYVENVVSKVNQLQPHIVVLTGDLGDGSAKDLLDDLAPLKNLKSIVGTYYVPGNHEYYWNMKEWVEVLKSLDAKALLNDGEKLTNYPIWIAGVLDFMDPQSSPEKAISKNIQVENYKILLAHQPKSVFKAEKAGFNLMLSGHTHWGQFFPFNLIVGFFNPYSKGLNKHTHNMYVYVNAGTGFWGPPVRLGVPSEITLIELTK